MLSSTCFLAPDNPPPLLWAEWQRVSSGCHLAWPWQRSTWLRAAYTFLFGKSAYDIDTLSQLEWAVFRPWKPMLLSNRSGCEVALNTCQVASLFLMAILTKAANTRDTREAHPAHLDLLPPNWQTHQLVFLYILSGRKRCRLHEYVSISLSIHFSYTRIVQCQTHFENFENLYTLNYLVHLAFMRFLR